MTEIKPTKFDGKRAKIIAKDHPHYNVIAECKGMSRTPLGLGMVFKDVETDIEFFVFDGKEVKWVD